MIKLLWDDWLEHAIALIPSLVEGRTVSDDETWRAIESSESLLDGFASVAEILAENADEQGSLELYHGYSKILERYNRPLPPNSSYRDSDFDFFKFLGHAFLATQVAFLVESEQWSILSGMLAEPIALDSRGPERVPLFFQQMERHLDCLDRRKTRLQLMRKSLHCDALKALFDHSRLSKRISLQTLQSGDYFLFLRALEKPPDLFSRWCPRSCEFMKDFPEFLKRSVSSRYASKISEPLKISSIAQFRERLEFSFAIAKRMFSDDWGRHSFHCLVRPSDIGSTWY